MGINDATTPETVLFQDILHHKVVVVGIYPDIVAMFETPFEAGVSYSLLFAVGSHARSEEHTSELQSRPHLVCRLLLEKKKKN